MRHTIRARALVPATIAAMRECGVRRITLVTDDGAFDGHIDQSRLGDAALVLLLAPADGSTEHVIIALDAIDEIVER